MEHMWFLIPVVAIVFGMATAMVAIVTEDRRKTRELDNRHQERMAAIEKGLELPPDPPRPKSYAPRERYLLRGLVWLSTGLAIALGLPPLVGPAAQGGWVAAAVGAAFLVFYLAQSLRKPEQPRDPAGPDPDRRF
jgi:hypothetical protein